MVTGSSAATGAGLSAGTPRADREPDDDRHARNAHEQAAGADHLGLFADTPRGALGRHERQRHSR